MNTYEEWFYRLGRLCLGFFFVLKAIQCLFFPNLILDKVPTVLGVPQFWLFIFGIGWSLAAISFICNMYKRIAGVMVAGMYVILIISSLKGLSDHSTMGMTALTIGTYLALSGGSLIVSSQAISISADQSQQSTFSKGFYNLGRILVGLFFLIAGCMHFLYTDIDVHMMGDFPGARYWVLFIGVCWFAVTVSFWFNLLSRLAAVLASVAIIAICLLITMKSFSHHSIFMPLLSLMQNVAIIGSCLLVGWKGSWKLHL